MAVLSGGLLYAYADDLAAPAKAADPVERSAQADFRIVTLADGLDHPWGMAFLPDGGILITERSGTLRLFTDGKLQDGPIDGTPAVAARGQGGLLDVAVHPGFAENRLVYLSYAGPGEGGASTEVARGRLDGMALQDVEVLFRAVPKSGGTGHFGSRLVFDGDGKLFISLGDRRQIREPQNLGNHIGTVVRLNDDGSVPEDNPFVGQADALPEIFSYGHRNVQGMTLHPESGQLWAHEHGPRGGDELNLLKAAANYGWPVITHGIDYSGAIISDKTEAEGMEQPVVYWDPSIAPSGMAFYDGEMFPQWQGDLFVGALAHLHLRRLEMEGDKVVGQESLLVDLGERIRDVRSGPDGYLYVLTDSSDGMLIRLEPAG
ncbi:PQQ-dependent sugar dehydrogenase [Pelagibius litoralis]|uniref:PQQ-dependent sugar dehydrogenase n=2 Tax=Pelagibius litoralis TaxID=374515 RepID=A0A967EV70_9PROT|nr:PQQ-dependent sugar dehydrogenase [Pelagibius litoralis]